MLKLRTQTQSDAIRHNLNLLESEIERLTHQVRALKIVNQSLKKNLKACTNAAESRLHEVAVACANAEAELEKAKAKASKAQELADWHLSHRTLAESQLEAARKQEPIIIRTMEGFEFLKTYEIGTKLYASPVPAQQAAEPIAFTENDLLEIASSYSAYAGADGDMYLNGWVKSYEAKGFISLINNRQRGQVMAEQLLKGGENER